MRIVLIQPRVPSSIFDFRYRGENLGLCSLAAVLRRQGHAVSILNDALEKRNLDITVEMVRESRAEVVGIAVSAQQVAPQTLAYVQAIKRATDGVFVCIGGIFASVAHEAFMHAEPAIDAAVRGEGEETLLAIVDALQAGTTLHGIRGVTFRQNGSLVVNPPRPLMREITAIPPPARDTFRILLEENRRIGVFSGRGCYGACTFCSLNTIWDSQRVRLRTPAQVVDELTSLRNRGATKIRFINDIFVDRSERGRAWLEEFSRLYRLAGLDLNLWMQFRPNDVDTDFIRRLVDLGLKKCLIGVESGSQISLDRFNKQTTIAENEAAVESLVCGGVAQPAIGFMMFHPYAGIAEIRANVRFLKGMPTFRYKNLFSRTAAYSGTALRSEIISDGLFRPGPEWHSIGDYHFQDPRTQLLHDAVARMREQYAELIWLEAAVDVEHRFVQGAVRATPDGSSVLKKRSKMLSEHVRRFQAELSRCLLAEFERLLDRVEQREDPCPVAVLRASNGLATCRDNMEDSLRDLQRDLGLPSGFHLGQDALDQLLE